MSIPSTPLQQLLHGYPTEVTSADRRSIDAAITTLPRGADVYIASLPSDGKERQVLAATELYRAGLALLGLAVTKRQPMRRGPTSRR